MGNNAMLIGEQEFLDSLKRYTDDEIIFIDNFVSVSTKTKMYNKTKDIYWNNKPYVILNNYKNKSKCYIE